MGSGTRLMALRSAVVFLTIAVLLGVMLPAEGAGVAGDPVVPEATLPAASEPEVAVPVTAGDDIDNPDPALVDPDGDVVVVLDDPGVADAVAAGMDGAEVVVATDSYVSVAVPAEEAGELRQRAAAFGSSSYVDPIVMPAAVATPNDPLWPQWYGAVQGQLAETFGLARGWRTIRIAVVDTGVRPTAELEGRVLRGWSVHDRAPFSGDVDPALHGTKVAQVAAGAVDNAIGASGTCPRCTILPVTVFQPSKPTITTNSQVAAGIRWAVDNGADIINLSLGSLQSTDELRNAVRYAHRSGVLMVAAAGNFGQLPCTGGTPATCGDRPLYPAHYPEVLAVAAGDSDGGLYPYSSSWDGVNLIAPGANLMANPIHPDWGLWFTGTSSAAPFVAGLLGLYRTLSPTAPPSVVWADMQETSTGPGVLIARTWGRVAPLALVRRAAARAGAWPPAAPRRPSLVHRGRALDVAVSQPPVGPRPTRLVATASPGGGRCEIPGRSGTCTIRGVGAGRVSVRVVAIAPGGRSGPSLAASMVVRSGEPLGGIERVTRTAPRRVHLRGWTFDPDAAGPVRFRVLVNGRQVVARTTGTLRPDVVARHAAAPRRTGFSVGVSVPVGRSTVCVEAINVGPGSNRRWCRTIVTPTGSPFGVVDSMSRTPNGNVRLRGWSIDPDTRAPVPVQVWVDNRAVRRVLANGSRPDVGRAHPGYGNNHGFDVTVRAPGGATVCVRALNVAGPGSRVGLGCRVVR